MQLLQKNRTTGGFRLAGNLMTMVGKRAHEIHQASTIVVFWDAVTFGLECFELAEKMGTHYPEQAQKLRSDACALERMLKERRLSLSPRDVHSITKKFDDAANAYQVLADRVGVRPRPTDPEPFDPDSSSPLDDAVSDEITLTSQRLFDKRTLAKRFALNMAATMQQYQAFCRPSIGG